MAYLNLYYRGDDIYNTTFLCTGNLFYYTLMSACGHIYVSVVNLNLYSGNPFYCENSKISDFYLSILLAPLMFILSAGVSLRGPYDL